MWIKNIKTGVVFFIQDEKRQKELLNDPDRCFEKTEEPAKAEGEKTSNAPKGKGK